MQDIKKKLAEKAARLKPRGFSRDKFDIKHDPKVIIRTIIYSAVSAGLLGLIIFSSYKIIRWKVDVDVTNEQILALQSSAVIDTINLDNADTNLINVDLSQSKSSNPDTVGWISVPGTSINYPFVQASDNEYYLYHSFNKAWSEAGWVFLDYRNTPDLNKKNQVIYAHGRVDGSMFGTLTNVLDKNWQNNPDNRYVKISTDKYNSLWQVFSTYQIPTTSDYIVTDFHNEAHFNDFIYTIKSRSNYDYGINVTTNDQILTLSTCVGFTDRAVLHAKLIKLIAK